MIDQEFSKIFQGENLQNIKHLVSTSDKSFDNNINEDELMEFMFANEVIISTDITFDILQKDKVVITNSGL